MIEVPRGSAMASLRRGLTITGSRVLTVVDLVYGTISERGMSESIVESVENVNHFYLRRGGVYVG